LPFSSFFPAYRYFIFKVFSVLWQNFKRPNASSCILYRVYLGIFYGIIVYIQVNNALINACFGSGRHFHSHPHRRFSVRTDGSGSGNRQPSIRNRLLIASPRQRENHKREGIFFSSDGTNRAYLLLVASVLSPKKSRMVSISTPLFLNTTAAV